MRTQSPTHPEKTSHFQSFVEKESFIVERGAEYSELNRFKRQRWSSPMTVHLRTVAAQSDQFSIKWMCTARMAIDFANRHGLC